MSSYATICAVISRIPPGRVATYGDVARIAGFEGQARLVGYALHALKPGNAVPWHRVINARGKISLPGLSGRTQQRLLKREKVRISAAGRIDLSVYRWNGLD